MLLVQTKWEFLRWFAVCFSLTLDVRCLRVVPHFGAVAAAVVLFFGCSILVNLFGRLFELLFFWNPFWNSILPDPGFSQSHSSTLDQKVGALFLSLYIQFGTESLLAPLK